MIKIEYFCFFFGVVFIKGVECGDFEKILYRDLLSDYSVLSRPVLDENEPVVVELGLDLQQIVDVDEKGQIIETNVWMMFAWKDVYMRWDPSNYGNVSEVRIPIQQLWKPDILLYNSADQSFDSLFQTNAIVYSDGSINWMPPGIIRSSCKIDISNFPFDDQRCTMKFGSWTYSGKQIDLRAGEVKNGTYVKNGEWLLMDVPVVRNVLKYECCPDPYMDVTFTFWIRRRTLYYNLNLVVPCILISALSLLGFSLPPDSGEKISLSVTIFMSLCVTMLMVSESMPQTSDAVPLIALYFAAIMLIATLGIILTVITLNYHHRRPETHEMPRWVKSMLLNWLPWMLRLQRPGEEFKVVLIKPQNSYKKAMNNPIAGHKNNNNAKSLLANVLDYEDNRYYQPKTNENEAKLVSLPIQPTVLKGYYSDREVVDNSRENRAVREIFAILRELRYITDRQRKEEEDEEVVNDWRFAAMVVDRLSFVLCIIFLAISTITFIFAAPHIFV